jgi:hypothetical protein
VLKIGAKNPGCFAHFELKQANTMLLTSVPLPEVRTVAAEVLRSITNDNLLELFNIAAVFMQFPGPEVSRVCRLQRWTQSTLWLGLLNVITTADDVGELIECVNPVVELAVSLQNLPVELFQPQQVLAEFCGWFDENVVAIVQRLSGDKLCAFVMLLKSLSKFDAGFRSSVFKYFIEKRPSGFVGPVYAQFLCDFWFLLVGAEAFRWLNWVIDQFRAVLTGPPFGYQVIKPFVELFIRFFGRDMKGEMKSTLIATLSQPSFAFIMNVSDAQPVDVRRMKQLLVNLSRHNMNLNVTSLGQVLNGVRAGDDTKMELLRVLLAKWPTQMTPFVERMRTLFAKIEGPLAALVRKGLEGRK